MSNIYTIRHGRFSWRGFLALFFFSLIFYFSFHSNNSISKGISAVAVPMATPTPNASNDSFSLELDRYTVIYPCPPGNRCLEKGDENMSVAVTVSNTKPESNSLRYKYTVSGGRIVGKGAKVSWDLPSGQPGTYTITVSIADKSGRRVQKVTKEIIVRDAEFNIRDCSCPVLSVEAPPSPTKTGGRMTFTANVSGGSGETITYKWTVTGGKIIEGQGTPVIRVKANPKMAGKVVTATVEIGGVCEECIKTRTGSGQVATKKSRGK